MDLKTTLDHEPDIRKHLFEKGYLITDKQLTTAMEGFPFYGNWNHTEIGAYHFYVYRTAPLYLYKRADRVFFLIGHAYNPFTMQYQEHDILAELAELYGTDAYLDKIDELTGVFIMGVVEGLHIEFLLDASGMQYGCYGTVNGQQYISSHMRLIGDLTGIRTSDYAERLIHYRWYKYMLGFYMPGDITCYDEIKRIIPNTYVTFDGAYKVTRFYPNRPIKMCRTKQEYRKVIKQAAEIMQNTMALIPKKWERPAISLTGGIDSNTTFAAANGNYDKYTTFSYISMYRESVDAEKAAQISERFHVPHKVYNIPETNEQIAKFDIYKAILEHNDGDIGNRKDDDTRKKVTLIQNDVCDVEVKSWISETIRAYAYKYFGRTRFQKQVSPRRLTSLYKIFLGNRKLAVETDHYFDEYLKNTDFEAHIFNYDWTDFFIWEMEHGGKCGLNIGVMKSCFDITIPYNNRKLLDLLLRVPLKYRINDQHHLDLKRVMNRELYDMNIRVVNLNETEKRKKLINLYYTIHSRLPY